MFSIYITVSIFISTLLSIDCPSVQDLQLDLIRQAEKQVLPYYINIKNVKKNINTTDFCDFLYHIITNKITKKGMEGFYAFIITEEVYKDSLLFCLNETVINFEIFKRFSTLLDIIIANLKLGV